ncbi:MAG: hypothetical protein JWO33_689 [Caulobacteraceae bacterium]|nr:hypothetical protein [Caulobacteraceae bacterium]
MASKAPPIPPAQTADPGAKPDIEGAGVTRQQRMADNRRNTSSQGRQGNIAQNTTHSGNVQNR